MTTNSDPALWEMFRNEVDTHMAVLSDGLLALEKNPGQSGRFDSLMRAAHSIKGAAKIVGIPAAVQVAHALEDCFVAAREDRLSMSSSLFDVLLEGVDLLGRVSQDDTPGAEADVTEITAKIERATRGGMPDAESASTVATRVSDTPTTSTHVLRLEGALDAAWAEAHYREIAAVLRQGRGELHLDLAGVETVDPIGLALLSALTRPATQSTTPGAMTIHLDSVAPRVAALLRSTGIDQGCHVAAAGG